MTVTRGSPGPRGEGDVGCRGVVHPWDATWAAGRIGDPHEPAGWVCSQKQPGAKGQPWGELGITPSPSQESGKWRRKA